MSIKENFRRIGLLSSASLIVSIIGVASAPFVARLYAPEDIGYFASVLFLCNIIAVIASFKLEYAALRQVGLAAAHFGVLVALLAVLSSSFSVFFLVCLTLSLFPAGEYPMVITSVSASLIVLGIAGQNVLLFFAVRRRRERLAFISKLVHGLMVPVAQITVGVMIGASGKYLLLIEAIARTLALLPFIAMLRPLLFVVRTCTSNRVKQYIKQNSAFITKATPAGFLNAGVGWGFPVIVGLLFGERAVGYFYLVHRVLAAPVGLLGRVVSVFYSAEFAKYVSKDNILAWKFTRNSWIWLALFGILPFALIGTLPGIYVPLLFGDAWSGAVDIFTLLTPCYFLQFVVAPTTQSMTLMGMQGRQLGWDFSRFVFLFIGTFGIWSFGESDYYVFFYYGAILSLFYLLHATMVACVFHKPRPNK